MSGKLSTPGAQTKRLSPRAKKDEKKKGKFEPEIVLPVVIPLTLLQQPTPFDTIVDDRSWFTRSWAEQRADLAASLALTDSILGYSTNDSLRLDLAFELLMFTQSIGLNGAQTALVYLLQCMLIDTQDQSKDWLVDRMRLILGTHCSELLPGTEHVDTDHLLPAPTWVAPTPIVIEQPAPTLLSPASKDKSATKSSPRPVSRGAKQKEMVEPEPVVVPETPAPKPANMTWHQINQASDWLYSRVIARIDLVRLALQATKQTKSNLEIVWRMRKYLPRPADFHSLDSAVEETVIEQPAPVASVPQSTIASPKGASGSSFPAVKEFELPLPAHADELSADEHAILLEKRDIMQKKLEEMRQQTVPAT